MSVSSPMSLRVTWNDTVRTRLPYFSRKPQANLLMLRYSTASPQGRAVAPFVVARWPVAGYTEPDCSARRGE